jgi:hypothetical protein
MTDSPADTTIVHEPLVRAIGSLREAIAQLRMASAAETSVLALDFVLEVDHERPADDPPRSVPDNPPRGAHTKP